MRLYQHPVSGSASDTKRCVAGRGDSESTVSAAALTTAVRKVISPPCGRVLLWTSVRENVLGLHHHKKSSFEDVFCSLFLFKTPLGKIKGGRGRVPRKGKGGGSPGEGPGVVDLQR